MHEINLGDGIAEQRTGTTCEHRTGGRDSVATYGKRMKRGTTDYYGWYTFEYYLGRNLIVFVKNSGEMVQV